MTTLVILAGYLPAFAILVVVALTVTLAQDLWAGWMPAPVPVAVPVAETEFLAALSRPSGYTQATELPDASLCRIRPQFEATFQRQMALGRIMVQLTVMIARTNRAITEARHTTLSWAVSQVTVPSLLLEAPLARPVRAVSAAHLDGLARLRLAIH
jgi:hypothetical protein